MKAPSRIAPRSAAQVDAEDLTDWRAELERLGAAIQSQRGAMRHVQAMLRELGEEYRRRSEVRRAGQWARGYVMGAMDPTLDEAERDRLVRDLAREGKPDLAVAVIHGWVANRPAPVCECWETDPSTWTRYGGAVEPGSQWEWNPECPVHL